MLRNRLHLLPLLLLPLLTAYFVFRGQTVTLPWLDDKYSEDTLPPVERFTLVDEKTGDAYTIYVQVPHGYSESGMLYPVFYAIDGSGAMGLYNDMVLPLLRRRQIPEAIFVGIDFPQPRGGGNPIQRLIQGARAPRISPRTRLLTPYVDEVLGEAGSGHADDLWNFLEDQLIPYIDGHYETLPGERGLGGFELGGLFTVATAVKRPNLFRRYIAIAPAVHWANYALIDDIRGGVSRRNRSRVRLYLAVGEQEFETFMTGWQMLRTTLSQTEIPRFELNAEILPVYDHFGVVLPSGKKGLAWVYKTYHGLYG